MEALGKFTIGDVTVVFAVAFFGAFAGRYLADWISKTNPPPIGLLA